MVANGIQEKPPYDVWMEEMLNASNPSYGATSAYATASPVEAEAATAAPFAVKHLHSIWSMFPIQRRLMPLQAGCVLLRSQEAMPDYYKSIIHPRSISVVESHVQSEVVADGSVGFGVLNPLLPMRLPPFAKSLTPQNLSSPTPLSRRQQASAPLLPLALGTWLSLPAVWPSLSESWTGCAPRQRPLRCRRCR